MQNEIFKIPKSWVWTQIGDIETFLGSGITPKGGRSVYVPSGVPFIRSQNVLAGKLFLDDVAYVSQDMHKQMQRTIVYPNDVLLNITGASIGRSAYVPEFLREGNVNQHVCIIRTGGLISPFFLSSFLNSFYGQRQIFGTQAGVTSEGLNYEQVRSISIPLPPPPEQHRIVAKIEELFTKLDAGVEALKKVKAQLKRYRQAVLKYAFEGKLTQEWREANKDKLEPASVLLERIKEERKKKEGGKFKELPLVDTTDLPEIPEGWEWARMGEISDAIGGFAFKSSLFEEEGKYQVIKIGNVKMGFLRLEEKPSFINDVSPQIITKYGLRPGDLVITLTGTRKKRDYGFVAMVKKEKNLLLNQRLALIRFFNPLYPDYFQYALRAEYFQNKFFRYETGNVGQGNVGMDSIVSEAVSIPPLLEQQKIVEEIETRFSMADEVEKIVNQTLKQSERLHQSILKTAFEGKLVPQNPTDEPAEKLMQRIKAEKAKRESETKGRRRKSNQMELI